MRFGEHIYDTCCLCVCVCVKMCRFPTLMGITQKLLSLYKADPNPKERKKYDRNLMILRILKRVYRILYFVLQMRMPKALRVRKVYEQWLQMFVIFLSLPVCNDLKLKPGMGMLSMKRLQLMTQGIYVLTLYVCVRNC